MAKKEIKKAAPKKAAPTKAAPRKKAAIKTPGEKDITEQRREAQNFKNSASGKKLIQEMQQNKNSMIEQNIFHRESNKTK